MNFRLVGLIGVVTAATVVVCEPLSAAQLQNWKCFTVDTTTSPAPHADQNDEYCIAFKGSTNMKWYLVPGTGMENWKSAGLIRKSKIPLEVEDNTATVRSWVFEVDVTDHEPQADHGPKHKKPDRAYLLEVNLPAEANAKAQASISVAHDDDDSIHNGTAHSVEN